MTVREHYRRKFERLKWTFIACVGAVAVIWTFLYPHQSRLQSMEYGALMGVPAVLALWLVLRLKWFPCPRCGADLFRQGFREGRQFFEAIDACPKCGLSFDDPWPEGQIK